MSVWMHESLAEVGEPTVRPQRWALRALLTVLVALWTWSWAAPTATAQVGPNLRPPGLADDVPIDRVTDEEGESKGDTGSGPGDRHAGLAGAWDLNADTVVYSAAKKRQLVAEAPSTVHVLTDRQLRRFGWRTLSESLRMVPGVQTRTWLAQYQSVMIRGLLGTEVNNTRILWLENGVPVNDVRDGGIWLDETYPVELIKRIEVVLGPGSSLYGTGAFQGVVNMFLKDPRDVPEYGEYRVGFGAFRTLRTSALAATQLGGLGLLLFASANRTDGPGLINDFRQQQRAREAGATAVRNGDSPLDPAYDLAPLPVSSGRSWQTVFAKLTWEPVRLSVGFRNNDAGFDGAEFFPAERYKFNRRELSTELLFDQSLTETFGVLALVSYRFWQNEYDDYFDLDLDTVVQIQQFDDVRTDPRYPDRLQDKVNFTTDQHRAFSLAQVQWQLFEGNELIAGLGGRYEAVNAPEFQTDKITQSFVNYSVFLQDEQRLFSNALILTLGGRVDTHREFGPEVSVRGALLYKWTEGLLSRLSYGSAFREPSMSQLYIDTFNARGNDTLNAETLQNVELSTVARPFGFLSLRFDAFATFMDSLILNEFDETLAVPYLGINGKFVSSQEAAAQILGFEVAARADLDSGVSFFAHYNFLDSRRARTNDPLAAQDSSGLSCVLEPSSCGYQPLDYDAKHRVGAGIAVATDGATASLEAFYVGETSDSAPTLPGEELTEDGLRTVPSYVLLQPHVRVRLPGALGFTAQGSYAFSDGIGASPTNSYYYEMIGVPVPRLTFLVGLVYPYLD